MVVLDFVWNVPTAGSSVAAPAALEVRFPPSYSALYCAASTLATTQSFSVHTAIESSGPWVLEASTSVPATANAAGANVLRITGPYKWIKPVLNTASTGAYTFRLVGVE